MAKRANLEDNESSDDEDDVQGYGAEGYSSAEEVVEK
jgi:hypothetical protein